MDKNIFTEVPEELRTMSGESLTLRYFGYHSKSGKSIKGIEKLARIDPKDREMHRRNVPPISNWGTTFCYADVERFFVRLNPGANRLFSYIMKTKVSKETELNWWLLCRESGLIPPWFNVVKMWKKRCFDIPLLNHQTHKLYVLLACTRYPREVPALVASCVFLKQKYPELSFINLVVLAHQHIQNRGGHTFISSSYTPSNYRTRNYIEHSQYRETMGRVIKGFKNMMRDKQVRRIKDVLKDPMSHGVASYACDRTLNGFVAKITVDETSTPTIKELLTTV